MGRRIHGFCDSLLFWTVACLFTVMIQAPEQVDPVAPANNLVAVGGEMVMRSPPVTMMGSARVGLHQSIHADFIHCPYMRSRWIVSAAMGKRKQCGTENSDCRRDTLRWIRKAGQRISCRSAFLQDHRRGQWAPIMRFHSLDWSVIITQNNCSWKAQDGRSCSKIGTGKKKKKKRVTIEWNPDPFSFLSFQSFHIDHFFFLFTSHFYSFLFFTRITSRVADTVSPFPPPPPVNSIALSTVDLNYRRDPLLGGLHSISGRPQHRYSNSAPAVDGAATFLPGSCRRRICPIRPILASALSTFYSSAIISIIIIIILLSSRALSTLTQPTLQATPTIGILSSP
ncbi:hypothetical protein BO94DRAFT_231386 [Aspergillus sclerotioniger CBS 115572]|uniref:Uncharacterized protein n=1 Tax=Aspergillus sclerotioniger CBS 115572 TaxID=1450535 RepID=A0A317VP04_9EURO|nr:hypothetical protein BO94DRAFT_231386 [Aspergillus sclerotioniger CBS 115572]PWY74598.1 hypothetical protein BO94DRAFT_231386 [Aspergillus sclerotioniger CBS 115572]